VRRGVAWIFCLGLSAQALAAGESEVLAHGRFTHVDVYRPAHEAKQFVLLLSGTQPDRTDLSAAALALAAEGALVASLSTSELFANLEEDGASCTSPDGDLENLSRYIQAYYRLPTYMRPILVGYASGATFAYAMLAQAPADLFTGVVSLRFCRTLPLRRPLCPGTQFQATPLAKGRGVEVLPATRLQSPWTDVQIAGDAAACTAPLTPAFLNAVPHAQEIIVPRAAHAAWHSSATWLPQLLSAYRQIAAQRIPEVPPPASLSDLPLIEEPAQGAGDLFAVFLSGDGGWAGIDKNIAAALVARGIPVAGLDSLRYFWTARTPQGLAADLDRMLRYYAFHWKRPHALLIGYSQGADVLPFAINRLSAAAHGRVVLGALLGLDDRADFEFHVTSWVLNGASGLPVRPEVARLGVAAVCIYGDDDADSLCPHLQDLKQIRVVKLAGGHHFNGDYDAVAQVVMGAALHARPN
jgi:type IV secretory pathway VirJ component